jgi:hypothetical protein
VKIVKSAYVLIAIAILILAGCSNASSIPTPTTFKPATFTSKVYRPNKNYTAEFQVNVPINEWVIDWSYTPDTSDKFYFFVYPNFGTPEELNTSIARLDAKETGSTSGSLVLITHYTNKYMIANMFNIDVITTCNWTMTVRPK